jgi:hypothetical protein
MHIEWLSSLALPSQIPAGAAVLDLGTQDLWAEPEPLQRVAARHLGPADCERTLTAIFDSKTPGPARSTPSIRSSAPAVFWGKLLRRL